MNMNFDLAITGLYASLLAMLFVALSFNVIRFRLKHKVGIGSNGVKELDQAVRVHGNFSEYIPLALIVLAALELGGLEDTWLHAFGATLFAGRVLHAIGLSKTVATSLPRFIGTLSTFITLVAMAITFIVSHYL
ncbi:glutathione S-transferase [Thalassotalea sp. M1531]|uniref:Glutathione S-transferase n=1 Tax=Thalassotalea algicola TaxID=2716224 RepID=A0A7Y0LBR8_9GAMM|nr:MAPEG family protein [Thalassotalea algicola]NMP31319.1 glutathione S-transferase [Thalassotalea algicola]